LRAVCDDESPRRSRGFELFKRFKDGREHLQDDPSSGLPSTSRNADFHEMMTQDRRWALRMIADELNINKETIPQILHEDNTEQEDVRKVRPTQTQRASRSNGDSHHAQTSSRLVKTIPVFLIAFSLS
jgi:hypothetical protein